MPPLYAQRRSLSALRCLMFFQDLMLRNRLAAHLQLASHVERLKEAIWCNFPPPCHTFMSLPETTRQSSRPLVRPFPIPSQPAKDLNSNHTFLSTFAKSKPNTHQALHFSFFCSSSSPTCSAEKLFTFIFTPSLYLPPAGSGNSAQRAETKHDTHTAHSHYSSNFPQKGTFDINQPNLFELPLSHICMQKKHTRTHTQHMAR